MRRLRALTLAPILLAALAPVASLSAHEPIDEPGTMIVEFLLPTAPVQEFDAAFGNRFGIHAGSSRCLDFSFSDPGWTDFGDHIASSVVLGRDHQPQACRIVGAELRFGDGAGRWLLRTITFQPDTVVVIDDYSLSPPASVSPQALPQTGSGGLAADGVPANSPAWLSGSLAAAAVAALLIAAASVRRAGRGIRPA